MVRKYINSLIVLILQIDGRVIYFEVILVSSIIRTRNAVPV